jgi:hypothetical protein
MLDAGLSFCILYTDLSSPTSNSIYQKIGYGRIADVVDVEIDGYGGLGRFSPGDVPRHSQRVVPIFLPEALDQFSLFQQYDRV